MEYNDIESIDNFTALSEDEQSSIWGRFTSVEYDYAGLMNVILLVGIFIVAKYIFKSFIMSQKRIGKEKTDNFAYAVSNSTLTLVTKCRVSPKHEVGRPTFSS